MARAVKDLRELINVSRLSFREDDTSLDVSSTSLSDLDTSSLPNISEELDSVHLDDDVLGHRGTQSAPTKRNLVSSHKPLSPLNPKAVLSPGLPGTPSRVHQPDHRIDEALVAQVDTKPLGRLLSKTNATLFSLTAWWSYSRNSCGFMHFWLKQLPDAQQFGILNLEYSIVREGIRGLFSKSIESGDTKLSDIHSLVHALLHEYPDSLCGSKGKHLTLQLVEALLSGKNEDFQKLMTNVRHRSTNKSAIELILAMRSYGLVAMVNSIVCFYCDAHQVQKPSDEAAVSPSNHPSVVHAALALGHVDVVKHLWVTSREQFAKPDGQGRPVLFAAVQHKQEKVLKFLLSKSVSHPWLDVNQSSSSGNSPLHAAVTEGSLEMVRLLTEAGADVNQFNPQAEGATPLHLAVMYGHTDVVAYLLSKGAVTDVRMGVPATKLPVDLARDFDHEDIVSMLT